MADVERSEQEYQLMALTPLDGRYAGQTHELSPFLAEYGLIKTRFEVEAKYLLALSVIGVVRPLSGEEQTALNSFHEQITIEDDLAVKTIEGRTHHDVNALIEHFRAKVQGTSLADLTEWIHFGLTSEDVNNLAWRLNLQRATQTIVIPRLDSITDDLAGKAEIYKTVPMLARTHGQDAVPTTVGHEFIVFGNEANGHIRELAQRRLTGKLNGAVGNFNALTYVYPDIDWITFSENFIKSLGLKPNLITTQINSSQDIIGYLQNYQRINGVLLDLDQDMWRYISDDWIGQVNKQGEIGSSTMPQKINPIQFENSEGNIKLANGLLETLARELAVSRLQRDLSGSTIIRNIGTAIGHCLVSYKSLQNGLSRIQINEQNITQALNRDWTILAEGAQVALRAAGVPNAYDLVKGLTRGKHISAEDWLQWVEDLPVVEKHKSKLRTLTPQTYIGLAVELTDRAIADINASRGK